MQPANKISKSVIRQIGSTATGLEAHLTAFILSVEITKPEEGCLPSKPYLTLLIDYERDRVLSFHLGFKTPDYVAVLEECARRHKLVPEVITVDGGREARGSKFEQALNIYGCKLALRPHSSPIPTSVMRPLALQPHNLERLLLQEIASLKRRQPMSLDLLWDFLEEILYGRYGRSTSFSAGGDRTLENKAEFAG